MTTESHADQHELGGSIGSWFGSRHLPIERLLAIVPTIAGFKLILT